MMKHIKKFETVNEDETVKPINSKKEEKIWIIRHSSGSIAWAQKVLTDSDRLKYNKEGMYMDECTLFV